MSPYIPKERREEVRYTSQKHIPATPGELNYVLTSIILEYLHGISPMEPNRYADFNEVVGVLECVKAEFIRRKLNPYEDVKMEREGDVYK